jgi:hypothetical protein
VYHPDVHFENVSHPERNQNEKNSLGLKSDEFYLSSSDDEEWGPDQLGEDVIGTDESFELRNIPCDT